MKEEEKTELNKTETDNELQITETDTELKKTESEQQDRDTEQQDHESAPRDKDPELKRQIKDPGAAWAAENAEATGKDNARNWRSVGIPGEKRRNSRKSRHSGRRLRSGAAVPVFFPRG